MPGLVRRTDEAGAVVLVEVLRWTRRRGGNQKRGARTQGKLKKDFLFSEEGDEEEEGKRGRGRLSNPREPRNP
jgi:hypothetical protein